MNLYFLKNRDGKYFKNRGWGGYGNHWVDSLDKARGYGKRGHAEAQITYWAKEFPEYGSPVLVICKVVEVEEVDVSQQILQRRTRKFKALVAEAKRYKKEYDSYGDPRMSEKLTIEKKRLAGSYFGNAIYRLKQNFPDFSNDKEYIALMKEREY